MIWLHVCLITIRLNCRIKNSTKRNVVLFCFVSRLPIKLLWIQALSVIHSWAVLPKASVALHPPGEDQCFFHRENQVCLFLNRWCHSFPSANYLTDERQELTISFPFSSSQHINKKYLDYISVFLVHTVTWQFGNWKTVTLITSIYEQVPNT